MTPINRHLLEDKIRGCIYGSILGDAMGLATEFMSKREAHAIYGGDTPLSFASIYQDSHRRKWVPGDFTDDTDQHMMVLASLVSLGKSEGMMLDGVDLGQRLAKWCESGFLTLSKPSLGVGATVGSVLTHEDFKEDPFKAAYSVWEKHGCDLAANGAVMRTGVIGCWAFWDEEVVVRNAVTAARVTHADPRCVFSSVVVCVLIARMLREAISDGLPVKPVDAGKQTVAAFPPLKKHNVEQSPRFYLPEDIHPPAQPTIWSRAAASLPWKPTESQQWATIFSALADRMKGAGAITFAKLPDQRGPCPQSYVFPPADPQCIAHVRAVVNDYKPLLDMYGPDGPAAKWDADIELHCFAPSIDALALDDAPARGYTLKCLGGALFCYTRQQLPSQKDDTNLESKGSHFKNVMTGLIMEAGDADTNGAVAGALVGCKVGYENLPHDWLDGLKNREWIGERLNALLERVFEGLDQGLPSA
ncbi:hypothetical protein PhCBS80983_g05286 [Powellomyces hirtus]|uniref:ADP-ribosylglycohydrolase n=1 Tax=Powellomyces hirtus TaxID=109895 RepID=A0A507DWB8_9FUNG|nr:hypothetical protein PhCBS80983_g05286 [Powellomyces hirtus]